MSIPLREQETTITIDPIAKTASIWTCFYPMIRKLRKFVGQDGVTVREDKDGVLSIVLPSNYIKVSQPPKRKEYTQEQRDAARERFAAIRAKKKEKENEA